MAAAGLEAGRAVDNGGVVGVGVEGGDGVDVENSVLVLFPRSSLGTPSPEPARMRKTPGVKWIGVLSLGRRAIYHGRAEHKYDPGTASKKETTCDHIRSKPYCP